MVQKDLPIAEGCALLSASIHEIHTLIGGNTMKVLLINGSPHAKGCTYTALSEIAKILEQEGIEAEILHIGGKVSCGCKGCGYCKKNGKCIVEDAVNASAEKIAEADGYVFGSPVHYGSACGDITSYLDRLFSSHGRQMAHKPGAAIFSCRRGGATASFDQLIKYFTINNMPVVSSQYWNMVHGNTPAEVQQDLEGMQIMRTLGHNMAWLLKCIALGKENGITPNLPEQRVNTNFIR